jgi:hypothetical protein
MTNSRSPFQVLASRFPPPPRLRRDLAEALRAKAGVFRFGSVFAVLAFCAAWSHAIGAQAPVDGPQYVNNDHLVRPANYREWVFVGSGIGLTYDQGANGSTTFTNVFVNPAAYRGFMSTGRWPDKSVFVLEFRASGTEAPPNTAGRFQTRLVGLEAEVKDSRFPDGWAFYNFRLKPDATPRGEAAIADSVPPLAGKDVASCVECHTKSTAVERTFVQFYPTLLEVARAKGTVKPGF